MSIDNHTAHVNLTNSLSDLLRDVRADVEDHNQDITNLQTSTQTTKAMLDSALSCAKLGLVWDPTAATPACIKTNPIVGTTNAACTTDVTGQLRYNAANSELQVRRFARSCHPFFFSDAVFIIIPFFPSFSFFPGHHPAAAQHSRCATAQCGSMRLAPAPRRPRLPTIVKLSLSLTAPWVTANTTSRSVRFSLLHLPLWNFLTRNLLAFGAVPCFFFSFFFFSGSLLQNSISDVPLLFPLPRP